MTPVSLVKRYRNYLILALLVIAITVGNYIINGGTPSNWNKTTTYGFTIRYPPAANLWITGLDDQNIVDLTGTIPANPGKGMLGFNDKTNEFAVTWTTLQDPSPQETLNLFYKSAETNSILRNRTYAIEKGATTTGTVNGHTATYQQTTLTLNLPDTTQPLYAKGIVVGWTCTVSGKTYVAYLLDWNTGTLPIITDTELTESLHYYLDTLRCH